MNEGIEGIPNPEWENADYEIVWEGFESVNIGPPPEDLTASEDRSPKR